MGRLSCRRAIALRPIAATRRRISHLAPSAGVGGLARRRQLVVPQRPRGDRLLTSGSTWAVVSFSLTKAGHFSDSLRRVVISLGDSARPAVRSRRSALISGMPNSAAVAAQLAS